MWGWLGFLVAFLVFYPAWWVLSKLWFALTDWPGIYGILAFPVACFFLALVVIVVSAAGAPARLAQAEALALAEHDAYVASVLGEAAEEPAPLAWPWSEGEMGVGICACGTLAKSRQGRHRHEQYFKLVNGTCGKIARDGHSGRHGLGDTRAPNA